LNRLKITFCNDEIAVYHIARGNKIKDVIEEIEEETGKKVKKFEWM
jgi:hypothetical protein